MLEGAKKDTKHTNANWEVEYDLIGGVQLKEVKNIPTGSSVTREMFRPEWGLCDGAVKHMVHVTYDGKAISAWHMHEIQTDHIMCLHGHLKLALYDDREGSKTRGKLNAFVLSHQRPTIVSIPPGVWHGVANLSMDESMMINYFNHPYNYDAPDEWRLPWNTDQIPFKF